MMQITVLGCNGPYPAPKGNCSGYLVQTETGAAQLDLGCGTLAALTQRMPPEDLSFLAFSHWHGDHCSDLLPLLYRLAATAKAPLPVYAPEDPSSLVWQEAMKMPFLDMHPVAAGDTFAVAGMEVSVFQARHPVPAVMYRLTHGGKTLCYTGDTNTVEGLEDFARSADLLLADGLFPRLAWSEDKPHLSASLCGALARDADVKGLVITHLNPAFDPQTLLLEAQEHFPGAMLAKVGMTLQL